MRASLAARIEELSQVGFDLTAQMSWRELCEACPEVPLPLPPGSLPGTALLVGNTKTLWNRFLSVADLERRNPLDSWTRQVFEAKFPELGAGPLSGEIFYPFEAPPRMLSFTKLAVAFGLGAEAPCHLLMRPREGSWWALRALVLIPGDPPPTRGRPPAPEHPCLGCPKPCIPVLEELMARPQARGLDWLALRESCPKGLESRYGAHQTRYHYTHDPLALCPDRGPGDGAEAAE